MRCNVEHVNQNPTKVFLSKDRNDLDVQVRGICDGLLTVVDHLHQHPWEITETVEIERYFLFVT